MQAQAEPSDGLDLIHSDQPLWWPGTDEVWPQHFSDQEGFGCMHPIRLGDWRYSAADRAPTDAVWYRLSNYGVFHCWTNIAKTSAPGEFGETRPAFLIRLGHAGTAELWALQIGARPGSEYLLLSREPGAGPISRFAVLRRECPRDRIRGGRSLDTLRTDYCSINTRNELTSLAKRMAKLPALGILSFEKDLNESE